jgi:membrane dipeptidase
MINFFAAFLNDGVAEVIMHAQKRAKDQPPSAGGTEEMPDDNTDWDSFVEWFQALGCPRASINDIADHVIHAATVAGIDHVGIGSDFDGVPALPHDLPTAAQLPRVTECLLERGLSESDIEKVLGANFLRVFEAVEAGRKPVSPEC